MRRTTDADRAGLIQAQDAANTNSAATAADDVVTDGVALGRRHYRKSRGRRSRRKHSDTSYIAK